MKNTKLLLLVILILPSVLLVSVKAQTGGTYNLSHNVIAGGGSKSTGGSYSLDGTIAQPLAGIISVGGTYNLRGGFWASDAAPTAATIFISGRVTDSNGEGIGSIKIVLTDIFTNTTRTTNTTAKGVYIFEELEILHFYIISISNKKYVFSPATYTFELVDSRDDMNFVADVLPSIEN